MHPFSVDITGCKELGILELYIPKTSILDSCLSDSDLFCSLINGLVEAKQITKKLNQVITVASLPRFKSDFLTQKELDKADLQANWVIELGHSCTSILDALLLASKQNEGSTETAIFSVDAFEANYKINSQKSLWLNGASVLLLGGSEKKLKIKSYATLNDPKFVKCSRLIHLERDFAELELNYDSEFKAVDVKNEIKVVLCALDNASMTLDDLDGYVTINRQTERAKLLSEEFSTQKIQIFQSKETFGHRGATDLLFNLDTCIKQNKHQKEINVLLVGNGVGYTWSAMVINLKL
jgi:3-oxoacyl-[acyl-carrier-protein] synthase III